MRAGDSGANRHVKTGVQSGKKTFYLFRCVLTVRVHKGKDLAAGCPCSGLDCRPIAQANRVSHNASTGLFRQRCRIVSRAIVDHEYFGMGKISLRPGNGIRDDRSLIFCRHNN